MTEMSQKFWDNYNRLTKQTERELLQRRINEALEAGQAEGKSEDYLNGLATALRIVKTAQ